MIKATPQGTLIEFKSAHLAVMTAHVRDADAVRLSDALHRMLGGMPDFFAGEPLILDFAQLAQIPDRVNWTAITSLLRRYQVQPIAVRNLAPHLHESAKRVGLAVLGPDAGLSAAPAPTPAPQAAPAPAPKPVEAPPPPPPPAPSIAAPRTSTVIVERPLRSGQQVYARDADLIVLGSVSPGAEVIADGCIHCYGPLRGRALAGARGDTSARIMSSNFGPELVSIAGVYRTFEPGIPEPVAGRGAQVRLIQANNQHTLDITPLQLG